MLKYLIKKILNIPEQIYNQVIFARRAPVFEGSKPEINGRIYMVCDKSAIYFGDNVRINSSIKSDPIGGSERTVLFAEPGAKITIGNNVGISNTAIHAAREIIIEDNVMIGGDCRIYDTDFHGVDYYDRRENVNVQSSPVIIRNGAFVGAHCIILKGVMIGEKAVIGAGAVVTKNIPDGEIWAGNPAKCIGKVNTHEDKRCKTN